MVNPPRLGWPGLGLLFLVFAAAAGTRYWYLSSLADGGRTEGPLRVQDASPELEPPPAPGQAPVRELDSLVGNITRDNWFGTVAPLASAEEKTAHLAPGYPWLLSWLKRSPLKLEPFDRGVRWIQCGLGALAAGFYFLFARRAFGHMLVGLLSGLFCALHPFWIISTAEISDGVLTSFLLAASLFFAVRALQASDALSSLLYGLGLVGLCLVRAALLPFAVIALMAFLYRCRSVSRGWLCALLAFLGFANGLVLWSYRDYQNFGLIPIVDSAGLHLWMGNNPLADGGPQTSSTMLKALAEARQVDARSLADELAALTQKERYDRLGREALKQIRQDPAAAFKHRLEAGIAFFFGAQWARDRMLWSLVSAGPNAMPDWLNGCYQAMLYGSLLAMLFLAVLGWRWTYAWRAEAFPSSLALVWIPLPYIASHAGLLSGPRLPLDGLLLCYAAFALVCLIPRVGLTLFQGPVPEQEPQERNRSLYAPVR
jgi:hypothetical protein